MRKFLTRTALFISSLGALNTHAQSTAKETDVFKGEQNGGIVFVDQTLDAPKGSVEKALRQSLQTTEGHTKVSTRDSNTVIMRGGSLANQIDYEFRVTAIGKDSLIKNGRLDLKELETLYIEHYKLEGSDNHTVTENFTLNKTSAGFVLYRDPNKENKLKKRTEIKNFQTAAESLKYLHDRFARDSKQVGPKQNPYTFE